MKELSKPLCFIIGTLMLIFGSVFIHEKVYGLGVALMLMPFLVYISIIHEHLWDIKDKLNERE